MPAQAPLIVPYRSDGDETSVDTAPVDWLNVSTEARVDPLAVSWSEVRRPSVPVALTPKPLFTDPPSAARTPSIVLVETPLASPTTGPCHVASARPPCFTLGPSPTC